MIKKRTTGYPKLKLSINIFLTILILGVISVFATNYITENGILSTNGYFNKIVINNSNSIYSTYENATGKFCTNGTDTLKLEDNPVGQVDVCRGTDLLTDFCYTKSCDVVCKSTDTLCGSKINSINTTGNIFIKKGFYNIESSITIKSNMHFIFENGATFNNIQQTYQIFRATDTNVLKSNITIENGIFNCQYAGCWYSSGNFTDLTIKYSHFYEGNDSGNASGIQIFFDAYDKYTNLIFIFNTVEGKSDGWDMVGSGLIYNSDFSHNTFRNGNAQAIGVNQVFFTKYSYNYFENVGNIVGFEGFANSYNDISHNIALYSGDIKLSESATNHNSSYNTVSDNKQYFGGGINIFNSKGEMIINNLVYGSRLKCIYNSCTQCTISNNKCINTNVNNGATAWHATTVTDGGIILIDSQTYASPRANQLNGNSLIIIPGSFSSPNGTVYSASYTGGIAIGDNVINTEVYNNLMDQNYDGYKDAGTFTYIDNIAISGSVKALTCDPGVATKQRTLHNSTTSCTCVGTDWKCWAMS